jgi:hypothetical protein
MLLLVVNPIRIDSLFTGMMRDFRFRIIETIDRDVALSRTSMVRHRGRGMVDAHDSRRAVTSGSARRL